ncbi:alpha/beta fold hydrolase [Solwaraspora sp. WMMB335]|uniref:alpha/beta fold hydrolase n=1 Tax=Solwaraspora sp. WMMB335 TaxID=3404118 RepID=UPI003B92CC04
MIQANGLVMHVQQLPQPAGGGDTGDVDDTGAPASAGNPSGDEPGLAGADGPPIAVLIHGIGSDNLASWYLSLAHPLAAVGFRVIMYDLRGHGRTERPSTGYRLDDLVDDLVALLDRLGVDRPVHLLGNSLGGTVAFGYAARHPDRVVSIVAVEAAPATTEWLDRVGHQLSRAANPAEGSGMASVAASRGERGARYAAAVHELVTSTTAAQDLPASTPADPMTMRTVTCPVLGIFGSDSAAADLAPALAELLPQSRLVVIPGHRHAVLVTARDQVRDQVLPWLARQQAGSPVLRH